MKSAIWIIGVIILLGIILYFVFRNYNRGERVCVGNIKKMELDELRYEAEKEGLSLENYTTKQLRAALAVPKCHITNERAIELFNL